MIGRIGRSRCQSSGGEVIPHTLPGLSSANPINHKRPAPVTEMQFTTLAVTFSTGRPSSRTVAPMGSGRSNRAAHPCGFTRIRTDRSGGKCVESKRLSSTEIWQLMRVPQRRRPCTIRDFTNAVAAQSLLLSKSSQEEVRYCEG